MTDIAPRQPTDREIDRQRKIRGRNVALLVVLVSFVVLVFLVTLVQLQRGTEARSDRNTRSVIQEAAGATSGKVPAAVGDRQ